MSERVYTMNILSIFTFDFIIRMNGEAVSFNTGVSLTVGFLFNCVLHRRPTSFIVRKCSVVSSFPMCLEQWMVPSSSVCGSYSLPMITFVYLAMSHMRSSDFVTFLMPSELLYFMSTSREACLRRPSLLQCFFDSGPSTAL